MPQFVDEPQRWSKVTFTGTE